MASTGSSSSVVTSETASAQVEIVVGLTSYNDAGTIGAVAAAMHDALAVHVGQRLR